jgi:hypothetical protein
MLIDYLAPILVDLRDILDEYLNSPVSGSPALDVIDVKIIHDTQAIIDSCCPGMGWVRVERVAPTVAPPNTTQLVKCPFPALLASIEFGVTRCACVPDENGNPPTDECLEVEWQIASADRERLIQAIMCGAMCNEDYDIYVDSWVPQPTSNCMGQTLRFSIPYLAHCDEVS